MSNKHPANNGKVAMTAWVDPWLRDSARVRAKRAGVSYSEWIGEAVRQAGVRADLEAVQRHLDALESRE